MSYGPPVCPPMPLALAKAVVAITASRTSSMLFSRDFSSDMSILHFRKGNSSIQFTIGSIFYIIIIIVLAKLAVSFFRILIYRSTKSKSWIDEGNIDYLGEIKSVQSCLKSCRYYVLPSYREGTPRSTLEALSIGRPIITTDVPGCRETVVHEKNGLLVPVSEQSKMCFYQNILTDIGDNQKRKEYPQVMCYNDLMHLNRVQKL